LRIRTSLLLIVTAAALAVTPMAAQAPQFRSGVDLVVVDAVVLDKQREMVTSLTATDFAIKAGGRQRKIVSVQYVRVAQPADGTSASSMDAVLAAIPGAVSNQTPRTGRIFLIVADVNSISAGNGHLVFDRIAAFVDQLDPRDLVGLAVLPGGRPRVDLTADHARVRDAAKGILGFSDRNNMTAMLPGEAAQIAHGDKDALTSYLERVGGTGLRPGNEVDCRPLAVSRPVGPGGKATTAFDPNAKIDDCRQIADHALDLYRQQSNAVLDTFGALADAMAAIDGPKTIVVVSEGMTIDGHSDDQLKAFAKRADTARVTLYALQPQIPLMEASSNGGPTAASRLLDRQAGLDGLASAAVAARGAAFSITGTASAALRQIDKETSGYYLIAFERDEKDKDNERVSIDVKVNRPGFDVRARRSVTPKPALGALAATKAPLDSNPRLAI
jgi:VWFA-related protein